MDAGQVEASALEANDNVEVEKPRSHVLNKHYKLVTDHEVPYRDRRDSVGWLFGFQYVGYVPTSYVPSFNKSQSFSSYYGSGGGSIELNIAMKYNFVLGSIGPQFTGGFFNASSSTDSATLQIIPITLGLTYWMDSIFKSPFIVPYASGGIYSGFYKEKVPGLNGGSGSSASGNSAFAMYYSIGLAFQLDWLDSDAHDIAYDEYGMENTFFFVEMRSFLKPSVGTGVPDLSSPLQAAAGLKFEF